MSLITPSEYENEMVKKLTFRIQRYTPFIFEKDENDKFNHLGSSILLKWKQGHYLVLTGHTKTKKSKGQYFTIMHDNFIGFSGWGKGSDADTIDIQVIRLDEYCINKLFEIGYDFFDLEKIAIDHDDLKGANYLVVGYS